MLEFKNISVKKNGKALIDNVSFSLEKGKITVLMGKNGSGKSTLLGCIPAVIRYSGEIFVKGKNILDISAKERAKKISFLPQIMPQSSLSVRSIVSLGRTPYIKSTGKLSPEDKNAVDKALHLSNMQNFADRRLDTLSGGEKRRAFIAMMLAAETPVMILDEPNAHLDHNSSGELCLLLKKLTKEQGKTVLTVMHDLNEAMDIADNIALLDSGKLFAFGDKNYILEQDQLEKIFSAHRFEFETQNKKQIFFF